MTDETARHTVRLTIFGRPTTKKTKNQVAIVKGRPRVFPSKKWREWVKESRVVLHTLAPWAPIDYPVNCEAIFYRERNAGDAVGYYQALADFLEICVICKSKQCSCNDMGLRLMKDDKYIVSWNGSELEKDPSAPRVHVILTPR